MTVPTKNDNNNTSASSLQKECWNETNFQEMVQLWGLSKDDQQKMRLLEQRIIDIDHWKNDPFEVVRYYKEYKGNLKQVERMFRHMISWRAKEDMDAFLERYGQPDPLFHQMPIAVLNTTDKDGDPIYVDRMGVADSWSLLKHFGIDAMTDYIIFIRELNNQRSFWKPYEDQVGHRVKNFTVIIDLHGLSSGHMRPGLLPLLQRTARISQDCYAGWGKRIILIRAPSIFKFIWSLVKHFFDAHIQELISIGSPQDYLEVLEQYIELENLPSCIAPNQGKAGAIPGYFEKVSLEGGPLCLPTKGREGTSTRSKEARPESKEISNRGMMGMKRETSLTSVTSRTSTCSSSGESSSSPVSVKTVLRGGWDEEGLTCQVLG